ncbi:hypothetical protein Tco_0849845 [Tanacetum coccineum]
MSLASGPGSPRIIWVPLQVAARPIMGPLGVIGDKERVISKEGEGVSLEVGGEDLGFNSNEEEVVPKVDYVSLVDRVFDSAFGGDGEEDVVMGEGVVVTSSSLEMLTKSFLSGMMVSLIFLQGLEEEA